MKKNLLLLTFLSILPLTISAQNENCGLKTTENIESTAIPSEDFKFANDFTVAANSQLKLNTITFNVITDHQIDFTDMQFSLYEDKTGTLGNLLNTFKLKLTKYEELNNDIGIFTYKLTFEIPQEIIVKNETNEVKSYWISTESYQASSIFFSINTEKIETKYPIMIMKDGNWVSPYPVEGVLSIDGTCSSITQNESCGINTPSNNLEDAYSNQNFNLANDFEIAANSKIEISKLELNVMASAADLKELTLTFLDNENGKPGAEYAKYILSPTKSEILGQKYGFSFIKYTFELPHKLVVENTEATAVTYWISSYNTTSQIGWETTSNVNSKYGLSRWSQPENTTGEWITMAGIDGVMTITANCANLGLNEYSNKLDKINFYPNPVNDLLTIQHAKKITSIEIFNLAGLKVKSSLINTNKETISLANLPSGVYIVNAIIEGKNQTFKIVKK